MKRLLVSISLIVVSITAFSQTQGGYVKTRGRLSEDGSTIPGARLSGATITLSGDKYAISGNNGEFSFSVPGKTYCVTNVRKQGYQLYDRDLLGRQYKYSSNDLVVVMDTPSNVSEDSLIAVMNIRNTLQRQLAEQKEELDSLKSQQRITVEEYRKQLLALYKVQDDNEKLVAEMAERYSTLDYDQLDEQQRQVVLLIQRGELSRADSLLRSKGDMGERSAELDREKAAIEANAETLKKRQEAQLKSEAMYAKRLEEFASDCYSHFEICQLRHQNDSAAYWLELRASKDTTNYDWQFETGLFLAKFIADYDNALRYFQSAMELAVLQDGEIGNRVADCYNTIGAVYYSKADYSKALKMHEASLYLRLKIFGEKHPEIAVCYNDIGSIYSSQGNNERALEMYQKALNIRLGVYGENHPDVALGYNNIGYTYYAQGEYTKALEMYQKALAIQLNIYGNYHPDVATSSNNIATIYSINGDYAQALELYQDALKIRLGVYGENHPDVATSFNNMGSVFRSQGDYAKAMEMYQRALTIQLNIFGNNHPDVATSYNNIGSIHSKNGDYSQALEMYHEALKIRLDIYGENHPDVATSYNNIGFLYSNSSVFL